MSNNNENMKVTGTVEKVLPLESFPSGFSKQVLVINTGGKYPQTIPVEFIKDKIESLAGLTNGQEVTAYVDLRGNEYNGKYYAGIQGWKLDKGESNEPIRKMHGSESHVAPANDDGFDEIPF
jgi:hypothetical protein